MRRITLNPDFYTMPGEFIAAIGLSSALSASERTRRTRLGELR